MKEIVKGKWQYARFLFDLDGGGTERRRNQGGITQRGNRRAR